MMKLENGKEYLGLHMGDEITFHILEDLNSGTYLCRWSFYDQSGRWSEGYLSKHTIHECIQDYKISQTPLMKALR